MRHVFSGFRDFIMRGNVVELAVAVVIGAAFTAVVNSLVTYFINPIIGAIFGKPNFDQLWDITLRHGPDPSTHDDDAIISVGHLLTAVVNFLLIAAAIYFLIVLPMNKINERRNRNKAVEPAATPADVQLLTEIRDLLADRPRV
ncbi:large conductance mechanosensitive channel protein MscL [Luteimicrobium sp. DT211]|uniref:large conductance mechanosensitive channel protein MscL n=1 Tax=Luteimicrobium sp. DT211 TaxID=3393412 RepID=UPI003CE803FC